MNSLAEGNNSYSGISSETIDAVVPRNEAICNQPGSPTVMTTKENYFGINVKLPERACLLMFPALIADGHWGGSDDGADRILYMKYCAKYYVKGDSIFYHRTK